MHAKLVGSLRIATGIISAASLTALPQPALAAWDRCEASAYNYCMRSWSTSGYDNAGECYYGVVRTNCRKEPTPPEGWGWWCYDTSSGTQCDQVY